MATKFSENSEKKTSKFYCENCDYLCFKKQHLKQHFYSKKHKNCVFNNVENSVNHTEKHIKISVDYGNISKIANKIINI